MVFLVAEVREMKPKSKHLNFEDDGGNNIKVAFECAVYKQMAVDNIDGTLMYIYGFPLVPLDVKF